MGFFGCGRSTFFAGGFTSSGIGFQGTFDFGFGFGTRLFAFRLTILFGFGIEFGGDFLFGFFDGLVDFFDVAFVFTMDAVHGFDNEEENPSDD